VFSKLTILGANDDVAEKLVAVAVQILAFKNSVDLLTVISPEQKVHHTIATPRRRKPELNTITSK
jgi:hypothetical protein